MGTRLALVAIVLVAMVTPSLQQTPGEQQMFIFINSISNAEGMPYISTYIYIYI